MATLTYNYTALSSGGKQVSGTIPAETHRAAIAAVIAKGLHPVSVVEVGKGKDKKAATNGAPAAPAGEGHRPVRRGRVTQKHIEDFTREMASLLAGGVPLSRAL